MRWVPKKDWVSDPFFPCLVWVWKEKKEKKRIHFRSKPPFRSKRKNHSEESMVKTITKTKMDVLLYTCTRKGFPKNKRKEGSFLLFRPKPKKPSPTVSVFIVSLVMWVKRTVRFLGCPQSRSQTKKGRSSVPSEPRGPSECASIDTYAFRITCPKERYK